MLVLAIGLTIIAILLGDLIVSSNRDPLWERAHRIGPSF